MRNYTDRLDELAKKYPKISTLEIGEDEIDEAVNENVKL